MEYFKRAKVVRLRSQHHKYLTASEDEEAVRQTRSGSSKSARWSVEPVEGKPNRVRLKSCYTWKYLSASDEPFLLGWTGKRVLQTSPRLKLDPLVEWEPIKEGVGGNSSQVKLRTCNGNFLRGNGGVPPWNNSVTHDQPSRNSSSQDWILWSVDILEVDYQDDDDNDDGINVVKGSLANNDESKNNNVVGHDHDHHHGSSLSRKSSNSSEGSAAMEEVKDYYEVDVATPKSAKSVRSNKTTFEASATPSPRASPTASEKYTRVSPLIHDIRNDSQHSSSFNKLKSMLNGLQDLLDDTEEADSTEADVEPEPRAELTSHQPHQLEVRMAKQTLRELNNMDFETVLSSGRDKKLEKSINILIADAKVSYNGKIPKDLANLQAQLKSMRKNRELAYQYLEDYMNFSNKKIEIKAELKKDAAKAHELETIEVGYNNMLMATRAKREEILKQLEEVESSIKAAEKAQDDSGVEIDELISRIGEKSQSLREMEKAEKSWQARKVEAERTLEGVEQEWVRSKSSLQEL